MEASEPTCRAQKDDGLFPYALVRKGQDRFLEDARSCFSSRTHLLAHAPTGMGKTAVSLAAGLECSLEEDGSLLFLTSRQTQHAAAMECLKDIWRKRKVTAVDIVARESMCLARRKGGRSPCSEGSDCYFRNDRIAEASERLLAYPLHVQEAAGLCLRLGACPYLAAMRALGRADVAVCDYNHVFTLEEGLFARTGRPAERTLLVVDEAHNLPYRIMDNHSAAISERIILQALNERGLRGFKEDLGTLRAVFLETVGAGERRAIEAHQLDEALEQKIGIDAGGLAQEFAESLGENASRNSSQLVDFLRLWSSFGRGSARFSRGDPPELLCRLLDPSLVARPVLEKVRCALLMSGTLHPPEMFAELLGIEEGSACRRYPSPFPEENRMVRAVPGVSSRFLQRSEAMYLSIAKHLREICAHVPGNLAIFFPSYEFMRAVLFQMRDAPLGKKALADSKELVKNEREAMLQEMRREGERALLASIGGSFTEGVDFCDNLLSAVVVVGLPLAPPSEELDAFTLKLAEKSGPAKARLYAQVYPAVAKVLQAAGRAIRSERDRAAIILLDERFLLPPVSLAMPEEHRPRASARLTEELDAFFGRASEESS